MQLTGVGFHTANEVITEDERQLFQASGAGASKFMWYQALNEVEAFRQKGAVQFLVRLPDLTELPRRKDGSQASFADWAQACIQYIDNWHSVGITDFQWGNEPNIHWGPEGGWDWRYYAIRAWAIMEKKLPEGVRIGLAPLSNGGPKNDVGWRQILHTPLDTDERAELGLEGSLVDWVDFICVNSYWQTPEQVTRQDMGGIAQVYREWTGKPVQVTEWGSSDCDLQPRPSQDEIEAAMIQEYPQWLNWAVSQSYIEAVYCFILGGTDDWDGFKVTPKVIQAIKATIDALKPAPVPMPAPVPVPQEEGHNLKPNIIDIIDKLPVADSPFKKTRNIAGITKIAVHYDAVKRPDVYNPLDRYVSEADYHIQKDWDAPNKVFGFGLMYHYKISGDGTIYQTQPENLITWHVCNANPIALGVCVDCGPGQEPTPEQLDSLAQLLNWLVERPDLSVGRGDVYGHGELKAFGNNTECPGRVLPYVLKYRAGTWGVEEPASYYKFGPFPETGYGIGGGFAELWDFVIDGFPLTAEEQEGDLKVQYFDNTRMEWKPGIAPRRGAVARMYLQKIGRIN